MNFFENIFLPKGGWVNGYDNHSDDIRHGLAKRRGSEFPPGIGFAAAMRLSTNFL